MFTDIEIAQQCKMKPIIEVASGSLVSILRKWNRTVTTRQSFPMTLPNAFKTSPDGKLILVTAINPDSCRMKEKPQQPSVRDRRCSKIGKKAIIALREPSLGLGIRH